MPAFLLSLLGSRQAWGALGLALLLATVGVQTARLAHAKSDLAAARAAALDPATHRAWQAEAKAAAAALGTCQAGLARLSSAVEDQNAALSAQKDQDAAATAAAQAALGRAQQAVKAAGVRAAAVLSAPASVTGCSDADALILKSLDP
ncbi:hypothetical protein [Phenylobacterium montanum]|uniref:Uncharacterized protein n=1 Tax=Phenylobacterium montanum TaxID=2823693 RepID=A0A975FYZ8_9CAUL|nr:hypothetical protein [Caulobacter sp. S6]QUD88063.1 hypothetical protein KCG34_24030 [Caulobacter sp. S6]